VTRLQFHKALERL